MKFNQWTLGLAAVGAVSLASVVNAEEAKLSTLNTALSNTVISGYVDVAAQWNLGNASSSQATSINQPMGINNSKVDAFSANAVVVSLDKALDESPWASGYHVDLNWGLDAIGAPVRQAYVALRTPVGNGIDWKVGVLDGITGYEGNTSYLNPNYSRSYGYQVNPASFTGALATYKIVDAVSVQAGMANRGNTFGGAAGVASPATPLGYFYQSSTGVSSKDYIAAVSFTAPSSLGFLKGSTLNVQTVQGFDNGAVNNYSVNGTFNTPVTGLKLGLAYDAVQSLTQFGGVAGAKDTSFDVNIYGAYASYQATDKLGLNLRAEYVDLSGTYPGVPNIEEITATIQYDLWANVVSRLEFRWDNVEHNGPAAITKNFLFNGAAANQNSFIIAANVVYKF